MLLKALKTVDCIALDHLFAFDLTICIRVAQSRYEPDAPQSADDSPAGMDD